MKIHKKYNLSFLLLLVIALITSILLIKMSLKAGNFLQPQVVAALSYPQSTGNHLSNFRLWLNDLFHLNSLRKSIIEIKQQNIALINQLQELKKLQKENILLKEVLKIEEETHWSLEMADIVLMDSSGLTGTFWINKGIKSGIKQGMNIITENQILIGRVTKCFDSYCQAESIFRPGTKISVENLRSPVLGVVEIDPNGNFRLRLVSHDADVEIGDTLISSSENSYFLKGLLVAKITKLDPSFENSAMKEFILEPLLNYLQISSVFIIKNIVPNYD